VRRGQLLGQAGQSGGQSSIHLHLELRDGSDTEETCTSQNNCFGNPIDWDDIEIDGWRLHEYFGDASEATAYNYDGSATKGATRLETGFRYADDGNQRVVVATVGESFVCDEVVATCEQNDQQPTLTQFAGGGTLGAGGVGTFEISRGASTASGQTSGVLVSTNEPLSVGGTVAYPPLSVPTPPTSRATVEARWAITGAFLVLAALWFVQVSLLKLTKGVLHGRSDK
jgi:hypothetical protein